MTKLYHLGKGLVEGIELIPDYQKRIQLVSPFIKALDKDIDVFENMLNEARYLREVLRRSKLREWSNCCKWATEAVFEYIRKNEFGDRYSRMRCNYYYDTIEKCKRLYKKDYLDPGDDEGNELFEVHVEDEYPQYFDMAIYDEAYEKMEAEEGIEEIMDTARRYWNLERNSNEIVEVLSDKKAVIFRRISWD
jgi:hypothetical protein